MQQHGKSRRSEGVTITPEETDGTASSFDFDDIEKILQKSPEKAAKVASSNPPPRPTASDTATGAPRSRSGDQPASHQGQATHHAPAPGEQWTSPAAKSRQKWVIAGAVAIGSPLAGFCSDWRDYWKFGFQTGGRTYPGGGRAQTRKQPSLKKPRTTPPKTRKHHHQKPIRNNPPTTELRLPKPLHPPPKQRRTKRPLSTTGQIQWPARRK